MTNPHSQKIAIENQISGSIHTLYNAFNQFFLPIILHYYQIDFIIFIIFQARLIESVPFRLDIFYFIRAVILIDFAFTIQQGRKKTLFCRCVFLIGIFLGCRFNRAASLFGLQIGKSNGFTIHEERKRKNTSAPLFAFAISFHITSFFSWKCFFSSSPFVLYCVYIYCDKNVHFRKWINHLRRKSSGYYLQLMNLFSCFYFSRVYGTLDIHCAAKKWL